ncbi:MAG TPA: family 16 glycoside hydrolase [Mycobacteriales bacterium]|nr:family 16 glycoside hydrolase [Mycobacteriales bacterium]
MRSRFAAVVLGVLILLAGGGTAVADAPGTVLYPGGAPHEFNIYARVIGLQHAGAQNGRLLGVFEHNFDDGTPASFIIRSSTDGGTSWSTYATVPDPLSGPGHPVSNMWQPSLFEFPHAIAGYPAGTLLLAGNMVPADGAYTQFYTWRSTDHGRSWTPVGPLQRGGTFGQGIWEPFLSLDARGRLVAYFSDERDSPQHSQMLVHVVSTDGGKSWGPVVRDVASSVAADRPGMPTVARMGPTGRFVLSYEVCGRPNCEVRYKFSADGVHWKAADLGRAVVTTDGRYPGHSPYLAWVPETHQLVLAGQRVYSATGHETTGEDYRAVFVNDSEGTGDWGWAPAPWTVSNASPDCNANYSPNLLPTGENGVVRYTAPTSSGSTGTCSEATGSAPIGYLPYQDDFASGSDAGWIDYGGTWAVHDGIYAQTSGGDVGAKALTGSTLWRDYTIAADVRINSAPADAGVLARVTDPGVGADSHAGYTAFFDDGGGNLTIARQQYAYEPLASVPVTGGIQSGQWYHLTLQVKGFTLTATLQPAGGGPVTTLQTQDPYRSFPAGMVGVRGHAGTADFKNVSVR